MQPPVFRADRKSLQDTSGSCDLKRKRSDRRGIWDIGKRSICSRYQVSCILHNFWKTALELGCTSVHLPLPILQKTTDEEKKKFTKIGISIHSVEEAKEAERLGASYLTAGHIYATDCKKGLLPRGLEFLEEVCKEVNIPVYGIGGIKFDEEQWNDMEKCGAVGGCIMSGMMKI